MDFMGGGIYEKSPQYPLRVGRKQKRAVLDANGIEIVIFQRGHEEMAQLTCDLLNHEHRKGLPWILAKCEQSTRRYMEAEQFLMELSEMSFLKRVLSFGKIIKFLKSRENGKQ